MKEAGSTLPSGCAAADVYLYDCQDPTEESMSSLGVRGRCFILQDEGSRCTEAEKPPDCKNHPGVWLLYPSLLIYYFRDKVSQCGLGWPRIHRALPASASRVLLLEAYSTMPSSFACCTPQTKLLSRHLLSSQHIPALPDFPGAVRLCRHMCVCR